MNNKSDTPGRVFCGYLSLRTVEQIQRELSYLTPELRSLVWAPEPPIQPRGASDCRIGGDCGLDFGLTDLRSRWLRARYLWAKEQRKRATL
jgi:hypothetical protein